MWAWLDRHQRRIALAAIALVMVVGFALHRDYGVPWDEPFQRGYGQLVSRYVFSGNPALFRDPYRVYGPAHELLLLSAETVFRARDSADVYAVRHLVNFLVFVVGLAFLYRLGVAGEMGGVPSLGVCLALVLSPPFFAHAFYNSKDLPFLACFVAGMYTLLRLVTRPRAGSALAHALVSAWLIAIRITGVLIPGLTVAFAAYCVVRGARSNRVRLVLCAALYIVSTTTLTWVFWPTLWHDPVASFASAFSTMSRYPWNNVVLYRGQLIPATDIPWHYALVWIAITTPLLYLAGFVAGLAVIAKRIIQQTGDPVSRGNVFPLLLLAWLILPLASVILLHSVMYDGWRHLFFIYPAMLFIAVEGVMAVHPNRIASTVVAGVVVLGLLDIGRFMIQAHPQQQVFFNGIVGGLRGARFHYEMDYWGLSYRSGLEAIAKADRDSAIPVFAADQPVGSSNAGALPYVDRSRFYFVESVDEAKYFLGTYRFRHEEYPYTNVVHKTEVLGVPILIAAAIHPELSLTPDTVPSVMATRERNAAATEGLDEKALRDRLQTGAKTWLSRYVRNTDVMELDLSKTGAADLHQGRLTNVRVQVRGGEIGDWRFNQTGVPLETLDVTLDDLIVDLARLNASELVPARLGTLTVTDLAVDATAINGALEQRTDNLKNLRLQFAPGTMRAEWSGVPKADLTFRLWVAPDPWKDRSDNLFFQVTGVHAGGWPLPARLVQLLAGAYSPAIDPGRLSTRLVLGRLNIGAQRLQLGTGIAGDGSHMGNDLR